MTSAATSTPARGLRPLAWAAVVASVVYVVVVVLLARHVTFYWDDYFLLLALDDRGLGGALLTGINGNWWPLATVGLWVQLFAFGDWYPGYLATNAILVLASAWAGWFALSPLVRRRPWLLAAALALYACSLGLVVNVTVMTMSWPLAAALAMTSAALLVRGRPAWAWGGVLVLAFLAESGLFAVLATTVATIVVATRAAGRGWTMPGRRDLAVAGLLVVVGVAGTALGNAVVGHDPIDYYPVTAGGGEASGLLSGLDLSEAVRAVLAYVPSWLATPLLAPMVLVPSRLPWLVTLVSTHLALVVVAGLAALVVVAVLWRRRLRDDGTTERWGRLLAAAVLVVPVLETAVVLAILRSGSGLAPRYAILWLLPAAVAWAVLLQARSVVSWLRALGWLAAALLAVSAVVSVVALPWTFRAAFDIDLQRWDNSADQVGQMQRCRDEGTASANQQVSPGLTDALLCQVVDFLDRQ